MQRMRTTWKISGMPPFPSSLVPNFHGVTVTGIKTYGQAVENGECVVDVECDAAALSALINAGVEIVDTIDQQLESGAGEQL